MQFKVKDLMINVIPEEPEVAISRCSPVTFPNCYPITYCNACSLAVSKFPPTPWCNAGPTLVVDFCTGGPTLPPPTGCGVNYSTLPDLQTTNTILNTRQVAAGQITTPQNLATIKAELKQAIAQVEAQEKVMTDSLQPQSLEELNVLDDKLTEALEDVRSRKAQLSDQ